jgi:DeoR family fructose operon transcriptional repressor
MDWTSCALPEFAPRLQQSSTGPEEQSAVTTYDTIDRPRFQSERQQEIARLVLDAGRVEVADLAKRFAVTTETIRRDLSELDRRRILRRVHGGAVAYQRIRHEPLLNVRDTQHADEKRRIARRAVEELPGDGTIMIDSGSTTGFLAAMLPHDRELVVFTNSIPVIESLSTRDGVEVNVIGGLLKKNTMAMVDDTGVDTVRGLTVDVLFMSTDRVSPERGFTTPYREEVAIKRAMIKAARRVVMLFDHHKIGNDQIFQFATVDEVDTIVTDDGLPAATIRALRDMGPQVICAT